MTQHGVLLVNLGSPDSTDVGDVRRYLREFLSDERVIDTNPVVRQTVLNLFILPFRPKKSAEAYASIWTDEGSPLIVTSYALRDALRERLGPDLPVALAMRYGNPSIPEGLAELVDQGVRSVALVPLYPHYAMSSYETVVHRVLEVARERYSSLDINVLNPFYDDPDYIAALTDTLEPYMDRAEWRLGDDDDGQGWDHVLFSYHGIPERHIRVRDPSGCYCLQMANCCERDHPAREMCYRAQVFATSRLVAERAGIPRDRWSVSFQSRLGTDPWLKPYTDFTLEGMPARGIKRLLILCPAFVSDCLETLEEIQEEGRETFLEAGGEDFAMVPCLNTHPKWVDTLEKFARNLTGTAATEAATAA